MLEANVFGQHKCFKAARKDVYDDKSEKPVGLRKT